MDDVPVTQGDRDAAAGVVLLYRERKNNDWQQRIRDGECDKGEMVQAFARHRIAAEQCAKSARNSSGPWVLVPREPTEAMIHAGEIAGWDAANAMPAIGACKTVWSAMLAAVDKPE